MKVIVLLECPPFTPSNLSSNDDGGRQYCGTERVKYNSPGDGLRILYFQDYFLLTNSLRLLLLILHEVTNADRINRISQNKIDQIVMTRL